jgi:hypothetical protein
MGVQPPPPAAGQHGSSMDQGTRLLGKQQSSVPTAIAAADVDDNVALLRKCPPGCVDLGAIAALFGLPGGCFCQAWLLTELNRQLQEVRQKGEALYIDAEL